MPVKCITPLLIHSPNKAFIVILFLFLISSAQSQNDPFKKDTIPFHIDPLHISLKPSPKANPELNEHFKRPENELMSWPNFPLTAAQIDYRDKKNNDPYLKQLGREIIESYINGILSGKKNKPVAEVPRF